MKICPRTCRRASSSPRACSAATILAWVNCRSGTLEHPPRDEHPVAGEHCRCVGERVCVEGGSAGDEPPWLHEALGAVDPRRCCDRCLGGEQLCEAGERRVETRIAGTGRLVCEQRDLAGARRSPEVVCEPKQQSHRIALGPVLEVFLDRLRQLGQRCRPATDAGTSDHVEVVLAGVEQTLERRKTRSPAARLIGCDRGLCGAGALGELELRDVSGAASIAYHRRKLHRTSSIYVLI